MLNHLADVFTAVSVLAGLWAAWLWHLSATVPIDPGRGAQAGIQDVQDRAWMTAIMEAVLDGGSLNSRAAIWTAMSVAAQAVATILGWLGTLGSF